MDERESDAMNRFFYYYRYVVFHFEEKKALATIRRPFQPWYFIM